MFVYTIVFNLVQGNIVTPLVYGRAVNLHPAVVLLAIPAGGAVAGIAGMFLAVPLLARGRGHMAHGPVRAGRPADRVTLRPATSGFGGDLRADDRGKHSRHRRSRRTTTVTIEGRPHHPADAARGGLRVAGQLRPRARADRHDVRVDDVAGRVAAARARRRPGPDRDRVVRAPDSSSPTRRTSRRPLVVLVVAGVVAVTGGVLGGTGSVLAILVASAVLYLIAPVVVVRHLIGRSVVDRETVLGVIAAYLLIGMFFAFVYQSVGVFEADPFFGSGGDAQPVASALLQLHDVLRRPATATSSRPAAWARRWPWPR